MFARPDAPPFQATVSIAGIFDPAAALQFRARLLDRPGDVCITLDFSHASEVSDVALALLASAFERARRPRVIWRGLTRHHERLLRYLGIEAPGLEMGPQDGLPG